jgi:hypothetical protein
MEATSFQTLCYCNMKLLFDDFTLASSMCFMSDHGIGMDCGPTQITVKVHVRHGQNNINLDVEWMLRK